MQPSEYLEKQSLIDLEYSTYTQERIQSSQASKMELFCKNS